MSLDWSEQETSGPVRSRLDRQEHRHPVHTISGQEPIQDIHGVIHRCRSEYAETLGRDAQDVEGTCPWVNGHATGVFARARTAHRERVDEGKGGNDAATSFARAAQGWHGAASEYTYAARNDKERQRHSELRATTLPVSAWCPSERPSTLPTTSKWHYL